MPIGIGSSPVPSQHSRAHGPLAGAVYADTKCFHAKSAVVAIAASYNSTIWLAMHDGRVEVRDAHTGQALHEFGFSQPRRQKTKVWSLLSVYDVINKEPQIWMGLSSGAIEVYTETFQLRLHLIKHLSGIYCLAQYRGAVVYAGSSDFTITQWRAHDGQLLRVLTGHSNYVRCLYAEGNALVSGSDDNTIRVWDVASGACLQQYSHLHRESGGVSALCRVGTAMWSGDHSGVIAVWRVKDGVAMLVCRQVTSRVTCLRKVGSRVYAGCAEGRVYVFSASDCTVVSRIDDHLGSGVSSITCAVEVDRYFVWSSSADNTVRCWHHDEHHPMTSDREGFLDMRWYYTTQRPYLQANEELLEQQREASELVVLSSGSDEAVRAILDSCSEGRGTAAALYWLQDSKLKLAHKNCNSAEEETRAIEAAVGRKKQALNLLKDQLAKLTEALQTARSKQPVPAQPAPTVTVAGAPSVLPAVPPSLPTVTAVPLPGGAGTTTTATSTALPVTTQQMPLPPGTTPLPPPAGAAVSLPQPSFSLISVSTMIPPPPPQAVAATPAPPPPPPPAVVPAPPPPTAGVPVSERQGSLPTRVITEAHVTHSRSFEPVLEAMPPPPLAATGGPKKTLAALLGLGGGATALPLSSASPSASLVTVPPPPPPPTVAVPPRPGNVKTPPDTPIPKSAAPPARRMSF